MRVAQELMNKPIITVDNGIEVGKVQGFYTDQNLTHLMAISLGSEGLLDRKETLIKWPDVITLGQDAVLIKNADCVMETSEVEEFETFMWRDDVIDRSVDTPGGTKIGRIGDIVIDDKALIAGFALAQTYVSGPIAANRAIDRKSVVDIGHEDGALTADLSEAEKADLQVVYEGFFAGPSVAPTRPEDAAVESQPMPS
jgi:sporulation protein YlmC with PRC-barrel domain